MFIRNCSTFSQISEALSVPKWSQKMEILLDVIHEHIISGAFALALRNVYMFHPAAHRREMGSCPLLHAAATALRRFPVVSDLRTP